MSFFGIRINGTCDDDDDGDDGGDDDHDDDNHRDDEDDKDEDGDASPLQGVPWYRATGACTGASSLASGVTQTKLMTSCAWVCSSTSVH